MNTILKNIFLCGIVAGLLFSINSISLADSCNRLSLREELRLRQLRNDLRFERRASISLRDLQRARELERLERLERERLDRRLRLRSGVSSLGFAAGEVLNGLANLELARRSRFVTVSPFGFNSFVPSRSVLFFNGGNRVRFRRR